MAKLNTTPSVELSDALNAGFKDAMDRVNEVSLDPNGTLVDRISNDDWKVWDASQENPLVRDSHGLDDNGLDDEFEPVAA